MRRILTAFLAVPFFLFAAISPCRAEDKSSGTEKKEAEILRKPKSADPSAKALGSKSTIITAPDGKKAKDSDNLVTEKMLATKKSTTSTVVSTTTKAEPAHPQAPIISAPGKISPTPVAGMIRSVDDLKKTDESKKTK